MDLYFKENTCSSGLEAERNGSVIQVAHTIGGQSLRAAKGNTHLHALGDGQLILTYRWKKALQFILLDPHSSSQSM